jgi:release factor glutamine methyltransferase
MRRPVPPPDSVAAALLSARERGIDRLDAQCLLSAVLARPRSWLLAHADEALDPDAARHYDALLTRRAAGEPLAYVLGEKEFFGLRLEVTPEVLIPRADTETLVEWALELLPCNVEAAVADLGTGSGAIALALAARRPTARVTAVDASADALAVAERNAGRLGLAVEWRLSDWFSALEDRRFALIVSNPPYIADGDCHLDALTHEPQCALTSGSDGLVAIRHIIASAANFLTTGGWLLIEHGYDQAEAVQALLGMAGFEHIATRHDLGGQPRCSGGRCRD